MTASGNRLLTPGRPQLGDCGRKCQHNDSHACSRSGGDWQSLPNLKNEQRSKIHGRLRQASRAAIHFIYNCTSPSPMRQSALESVVMLGRPAREADD
jgi:hypothetical protein